MIDKQILPGRRPRITELGNGKLYRAIVALPDFMTELDQPLQERVVFFEVPHGVDYAGYHLESLLAKVWCVDTLNWCNRGTIYNIFTVAELEKWAFDRVQINDLTLFEIGAGGDGINAICPNRIHYARVGRVDLFVTPRVARRLQDALDTIELLYQSDVRGKG